MSSLCPRCLVEEETNHHIYCCPQDEAVKQRKKDWQECWKSLHTAKTSVIIERTWRLHLKKYIAIPYEENIADSIPIAYGETAFLLCIAISEQEAIGWEKLLLGMGSSVWRALQAHIDSSNPNPPKRTANDWINTAISQLLKFSIRCWKFRNETINGSTKQEQRQIALANARDNIKAIYKDPPSMDPQFRSIFDVPLEHRLRLPLQAAEKWIALIKHQVKVTHHNLKILLRNHLQIPSHFKHMQAISRRQEKERNQPLTPRRAHRRAVQLAVKAMREKLYASKKQRNNQRRRTTRSIANTRRRHTRPAMHSSSSTRPPLRHHPP
mmetsp:Transcript_5411/g.7978  ORF Transcript_5411/g.7978 Transcript_5411/m.7978 type:complete len:324 (+) Transcript_5411:1067-2038(+)